MQAVRDLNAEDEEDHRKRESSRLSCSPQLHELWQHRPDVYEAEEPVKSQWCSILELVRTAFVPTQGRDEEVPPRIRQLADGKAAACPVAPPKADGIGEPHRLVRPKL